MSDYVITLTAVRQASLSFTIPQSLLRLTSIESVMPSNHLILCCPLLLLSCLPQHQGLLKWAGSSHQVAKVRSFSFSISPSNELSGLISFRIDWFDILAVQGTLKSLLHNHNSKALVLSSLYGPTLIHTWLPDHHWKIKVWLIQTFVGKVMSLLFNMLSRFVTTFLLRSKSLLISWQQSLSTVILEPKKINLSLVPFFPIYLPWSGGTRCHDLCFECCFKAAFSLSCFTKSRGSSVPLCFMSLGWVSSE